VPTFNADSILDSVKKALGLDFSDTSFDPDVTMFINSAFGPLQQLGVGPDTGFFISDNTVLWSDYVARADYLGMVQAFIIMSTRLVFDPPATSFGLDAIKGQLEQLSWRINVMAETTQNSGWWDLTGLSDFPAAAALGDFGFDSTARIVYVNATLTQNGYWWDLTGLSDFPIQAIVGEYGYDTTSGQVWRKAT
jgi:hypothetical protein